ncbi:MAG: hypothetical protein NTV32_07735 [Gammaproteobacteria bacterium]|nr:hypothetical protein [Gammaproteobacteria bacterium]
MTFFLGVLSVLMMVVFPGAIILKLLKADQKWDPWLFVVCVFALSLVVNLLIVVGLTLIHQYQTLVLQNLAALECLGFVFLYQALLDQKINGLSGLKWLATYPFKQRPLQSIALLLTFLALLNWLSSFGNPFGYWDATVSYNRWATDFAANHMPTLTWHYPQLLPANWSMTYVLMGVLPDQVQLQFFPAAIQGFFFIGLLLLLWVLYRQEKKSGYLAGLVLIALIFWIYYQKYLNVGYADIPATFFNFAALTCTLLAYGVYAKQRRLLIVLSLLFTFGAAMTKSAGLYIAVILPILHELFESQKSTIFHKTRRLALKYLFLIATIAPWYIYSSLYGSNMGDFSDVFFLTHDAAGHTHFIPRLYDVLNDSYFILVLGVISLVFRSWVPRKLNLIFYFFIPYFFIWSIWFSYDSRNIALFIPIVCLNAGFVLSHNWGVIKSIKRLRIWSYSIRVWMLLVLAVLIAGVSCLGGLFGQRNLIIYQETEKNFSLHAQPFIMRLYAYTLCPGFQGKILTDYAYFNYLPLLKDDVNIPPLSSYNKNMEPGYFQDLPAFLLYMKENPDIHYLLLNHNFDTLYESKLWNQYFNTWIKEKMISAEFVSENVGLYKINVNNAQLADVSAS